MIWERKDLKCHQFSIKHSDITAVIYDLEGKNRKIMLVSVYIPCIRNQRERDRKQLITRLSLIKQAYAIEKSVDVELELILTGDFNRWDSLWGGNQVATHGRQGEAEPLVELMAELNLQSLLPRGIITYSAREVSSTIDLIFTTARLAEEVEQSEVHECNHGSDHEAILSRFSTAIPLPALEPLLIFKSASWPKICQEISNSTSRISANAQDIDNYTQQLMSIVTEAIEKHVPKAKPSPYAKRW